jgi:hypothetical protein
MKQFGSMDEMMDYMREEEAKAQAAVHPAQASIGRGEYVIKPTPHCLVFGYIFDTGETGATEPSLFERGYRTGRWYSEACVGGEEGDSHVVTLWRIFKEEFDAAKDLDWEMADLMSKPWAREMLDRVLHEQTDLTGATGTMNPDSVPAQEDPS